MRKYVVVIRQTGNALTALAAMASCHSACPFLASYDPSCLSSRTIGQLDLTRPVAARGMRLIKSDKLIASTNFARVIELSDDTMLNGTPR